MKIIIEIEDKEDFDPQNLINWLNDTFAQENMGTGSNMWARLIGVESEDDEND